MRGVMGGLQARRTDEITVLDMEASIEHLSRGTVRDVDALLVVAEPYYRALETVGRLVPLARDLGLKQVWVVANKARTERDETGILEYCARRGFEVLGVVPFDESVTEADHVGRALMDYAPTASAVRAVEALAATIVERLGVPAPATG